MSLPEIIAGGGDVLLLCDHASNVVPEGIELGIPPELLDLHIAIDIGAEPLTRALAARLDAPAILATVSRLVIDLHREPEHPELIPTTSDGRVIPGNAVPDREERIERFHRPYHEALAALIERSRPRLLASIHSFTPRLESGGGARPWEVGILYNRDDRAARIAIDLLRAAVERNPFRLGSMEIPITVSAGVADYHSADGGFAEVLRRADDALYRAKSLGRNRVELASDSTSQDENEPDTSWAGLA